MTTGETWSGWDIERHGIQIDFVDSQGSRRSATYAHAPVKLLTRTLMLMLLLLLQVFARCRTGAAVEQAAGAPLPRLSRRRAASSAPARAQAIDSLIKKSGSRDGAIPTPSSLPLNPKPQTLNPKNTILIPSRLIARAAGCHEGHALPKRQGEPHTPC